MHHATRFERAKISVSGDDGRVVGAANPLPGRTTAPSATRRAPNLKRAFRIAIDSLSNKRVERRDAETRRREGRRGERKRDARICRFCNARTEPFSPSLHLSISPSLYPSVSPSPSSRRLGVQLSFNCTARKLARLNKAALH